MRVHERDFVISLFQFTDESRIDDFYAYCDSSLGQVSEQQGWVSSYGYLATCEHAKYQYIGITELDSIDVFYEMSDSGQFEATFAPPRDVMSMMLFAKCATFNYASEDLVHRSTTSESRMWIHPASISVQDREGGEFKELLGKNIMMASSRSSHIGYRGFTTTNPTAIHNYFSMAEWRDEEGLLAYENSEAYKVANSGRERIVHSGYPGVYRLALGQRRDGFDYDSRARSAVG